MRIPGFRKGKVPAQMVIQQLGRQAVLDEAVRAAMPGWYERAVTDAKIAAIGDPKLDMDELPEKGAPLAFSIEVAVRPTAKLGDYKGLEVGRREPEASDTEIDEELDRIREQSASLETVDRPAKQGDFVVLDFLGTDDGEPFVGASADEERDVTVTFPDDYQAEHLAGKEAVFASTVREVKEKRVPELDDEFALDVAGMDSLQELREDIANRLRDANERAIETQFREAVLDAAVDEAEVDIDHDLVHAKAHDMWNETARRLQRQGLDPAQYLQFTGKEEEELVTEAEPEAERALKREAVLAAVVDAENIEVTDDELLEAMREANAAQSRGGQSGPSEKALRRSLDKARKQGRDELLREDIAMRKALDTLVENAKPISVEQAEARGKLWTPDKEESEEGDKELWTPGS
jgi:trigger factor